MKEKEQHKDLYEKATKLKKLKIIELEKHLTFTLKKESYVQLQLGSPEIGKDVIVPFTIHDSNSKRDERESSSDLTKLIKKKLKGTNWRLMTDGVSYRLGMLSGRLRGYEQEEGLVKLVRNQ